MIEGLGLRDFESFVNYDFFYVLLDDLFYV